MQTTKISVLVVITVGLAVALLSFLPGTAQVKAPPDVKFKPAQDSPGPVTFSHENHKEKVDKCTACHVKVFKMKQGQTGPLTMEKMKAGEQCGACHNGKTTMAGKVVFAVDDGASCVKCHRS
jgi:c(7)-type cytochrome triheme protein